ncbi:inositol phosphorylceramide synthase [Paenibacillus chartarius]|uniref:Inositol phosphorylceramide synthase n=1 Tax=Paenibacillus chartarius TaxID=747481 RepID=A0ABV6DF32_9BACL
MSPIPNTSNGTASVRSLPKQPGPSSRRRAVFAMLWMLIFPLLNTIYVQLNNDDRGVHSLLTDLDKALPFIPAFIVPYLLWYGFLFGGLALLAYRDLPLYGKTIAALAVTLLTCYVIYFGYQTTVPRPPVLGEDVFARLVRFMQVNDAPYNCFPSIHAASSYLLLRAYSESKATIGPAIRTAVTTFALLIIASTFFLKQHVFMDAVGAVIVVELARIAVRTSVNLSRGEHKLYGARNDPARR